jgi:integrase
LGSLDAVPADRPKRRPTVLSRKKSDDFLYGTGMRISECCQLRVCDLDFDRGQIIIRGGKGNKDRATMLPRSLEERLKAHLEFVPPAP